MGMGIAVCRAVLILGLVLLVTSLASLALASPDTPHFVAALLAVGVNMITVAGAALLLRRLLAKERDAGRR